MVLRIKAAVLEDQIADLMNHQKALNDHLDYLRQLNRSVVEKNSELVAKMATVSRAATRGVALEDEVEASRKMIAALRQQNEELIENIVDGHEVHTSAMSMSRNPSFRSRADESSSSQEGILERQIDLLKAQNAALKTANLALNSEIEGLISTTGRLRLALPVGCGLMSAIAVVASVFAFMCMHRSSYQPQRSYVSEDPASLEGRAWPSAPSGSRVRSWLIGDSSASNVASRFSAARSPIGEIMHSSDHAPEPRSPCSPSARGTLLRCASSPKVGPNEVV